MGLQRQNSMRVCTVRTCTSGGHVASNQQPWTLERSATVIDVTPIPIGSDALHLMLKNAAKRRMEAIIDRPRFVGVSIHVRTVHAAGFAARTSCASQVSSERASGRRQLSCVVLHPPFSRFSRDIQPFLFPFSLWSALHNPGHFILFFPISSCGSSELEERRRLLEGRTRTPLKRREGVSISG